VEKDTINSNYDVEKEKRIHLERDLQVLKSQNGRLDEQIASANNTIAQNSTVIQHLQHSLETARQEAANYHEEVQLL
jgi:hypothetical protein